MIRTYLFELWSALWFSRPYGVLSALHELFLLTRLGPIAEMLNEQEEGHKYVDYSGDATKNHEQMMERKIDARYWTGVAYMCVSNSTANTLCPTHLEPMELCKSSSHQQKLSR
jgi:hypothetical protein